MNQLILGDCMEEMGRNKPVNEQYEVRGEGIKEEE
jgi:hypothetical protein